MGLTRIAITRPLFITMVVVAMVLLGGISYFRLGVDLFPNINFPVVSVVTSYPGAAPEDVERLVTKPIEDAVVGLNSVDTLTSRSQEGLSVVTIQFRDGIDQEVAFNDVQRKVSAVLPTLPVDTRPPSVNKFDFSAFPILQIALSGTQSLDELRQMADDDLRPRLEAVDGVGAVDVTGGLEREVQVKVHGERLRAYNLSLDQITAALARENISLPGGSLERGDSQTNVRLRGLFQSTDELKNLVLSSNPPAAVHLRDVADVEETYQRLTRITRVNGQPGVTIAITKQGSANAVKVSEDVHQVLADFARQMPAGSHLEMVSDSSTFTRASLTGVQRSLGEAVILTGLVLLLFLHTLRSTVIVLLAIPTSLITTFVAMSVLGLTLNMISTMGLALVIGILVDDSIVVLENIFRHLELGETPWTAALNGRGEIGLAAIAITLVDVIIFTPVGFLAGQIGSFFREFALVVAASTLLSLFISFTLTPMLASRWLRAGTIEVRSGPWAAVVRGWERGFDRLLGSYRGTLAWVLRHRWVPPVAGALLLVGAGALVPLGLIRSEFTPASDQGVVAISLQLPPGSSLAATDRAMRQIEDQVRQVPEVATYLSFVGSGGQTSSGLTATGVRVGQVIVRLQDKAARQRSSFQIIDDLRARTRGIPDATIAVSDQAMGGSSQPVQLRVSGPDLGQLSAVAAQVEEVVRSVPGTRDVTNSGTVGSPETQLVIDRARVADLGVSAQTAATALRTAVEGTVASKLRPSVGDERDIRVIAADEDRADLERIKGIPISGVRAGQPIQVSLGQITRQESAPAPAEIARQNRQRSVTVASALEGRSLGEVSAELNPKLAALKLPPGYSVTVTGTAQQFGNAMRDLIMALGLSILLIYMMLVALYESFTHPLVIMFALPVSLVGALLALALTRESLNILSMIGLIMLMGLVGKNGILVVDYTNTLRKRGLDRTSALLEAGPTRLRPVLMTTMALVLGLLPLALHLEEGSEFRSGMAVVIIGGMLSSTFLSLVLIPAVYTYLDDAQELVRRLFSWRPGRSRAAAEPRPRVPSKLL